MDPLVSPALLPMFPRSIYALVNIAAFGKKKVAKVEHSIISGMLNC